MKILCRLFGHQPESWYQYMMHPEIGEPYRDGIGRAHRDLRARCSHCGEMFKIGKTIDPLLSTPTNVTRIKRTSDQSVEVVFTSCRAASEFENQMKRKS